MLHWLPYDERRLLPMLRLSRREVLEWLRDDLHHTLEQLLRSRGLRPTAVAEQLVGTGSSRADAAQLEQLRERALRTLSQSHLAQHVLFHYLHQPEVSARAWEVFGVSPSRFRELRSAATRPRRSGRFRGGRGQLWQPRSGASAHSVRARAPRQEKRRAFKRRASCVDNSETPTRT